MPAARFFARSILACACCTAVTAFGGDESLPPPKYLRQLGFSMPFSVAPAANADEQVTELSLYVSANLGRNWDVAQRVTPETRAFTYRAPADGEYWFVMRTTDRRGRVLPEAIDHPDMRVIVDTAPPRLELTAVRGDANEIKANWVAVDPQLNADSLKIEYQTASGAWRPVALDRPRSGADRTTSRGTLTWWPTDAPTTGVQVRAEISDFAGNTTTTQAKTDALPSTQGHVDITVGIQRPAQDTLVQSATPPFESTTAPNAGSHAKAGSAKKSNKNSLASASRNGATTDDANGATNSGTQWPADHSSDMPFGRGPIPTNASSDSPPSRSDGFQLPPATGGQTYIASANRGFEDVNPPIRNQVLPGGAASSSNAGSFSILPPGERPRMVNSKSFDVDYEVDSVGPSGIARVELWGTRDGGRNWTSYGLDPDNRSPMHVAVDGEGLYGFRLAVQAGNGFGGTPPRPGDMPELWVGVDLTKPTVRLIGTQAGEGPHAGELLIRWEASDAALAPRPITLYFSDRPEGPWTILAAGLENSGSYVWRPDNRVPPRICLRVEARDEAGNTATFDSTEPVSLQQIQPQGRLRGVRSVTDTATGGRLYEFYR